MLDLGLLVLKVLGVIGGAAVGALVVGLIVQFAARSVSTRPVPRSVLNVLRGLGAVAAGLAVWLWVFGPPGSGGWGGSGGWWPFGQKGPSGGPGPTGTERGTGPAKAPATQSAPKEVRDTLTVTMRGGALADADQKFYVLQGDEPRTLEGLAQVILERQKENPELKFVKIVTLDTSVADNHPAVQQLKRWAREHGLETIGP